MTGDTPSRIINPNDRSVVPLFGDGGTAAIIRKMNLVKVIRPLILDLMDPRVIP